MVRQGVGLIPCVSETDGEPLLAMWLMVGTRSAGFNRYRALMVALAMTVT
jgi:hypothetical protein